MAGAKGLFVVLEGPDGAGKSTQQQLLGMRLVGKGLSVVLGKEPTQGPIGKQIYALLRTGQKGSLPKGEFQKLYLRDRQEDIQANIAPAIAQNRVLIWDRYEASTEVYYVAEGGAWDEVAKFRDDILDADWPLPDIEIILDVPPEECWRRLKQTGKELDYFETTERLTKIYDAYRAYEKRNPNVVVIDSMLPIETVYAQIEKMILARVGA